MEAKATKKTEENKENKNPYIYAVGKRKTAVACVKIFPKGKGEFKVNGKSHDDYFHGNYLATFLSPFKVAEADAKSYDVEIKIVGGGVSASAEACLHGISRALVEEDETRRGILRKAGFLTRDGRSKERKKPGLKRARRSPQWSKR